MAFVGEDGIAVWTKVEHALLQGGSSGKGAGPVAIGAFSALRAYLVGAKGNPQLQFLPFAEADADAANGTALLSGACRVYGMWVKKLSSGTDNTVKIFNNATVDTTSTDQKISIILELTDEEAFAMYPNGFVLSTGITITQHTTLEGSTDGSDGGDGFILIGA